MTYLIALLFVLYGGFMSRWHGGGFIGGVNKTLKNFLWALPHVVAIFLINPWLAPLGFINMLKATGHGRGLGSDEPMREDFEPEKSEYIIPTILNLFLVWPKGLSIWVKNIHLKLRKKPKVQIQLDEYTVDWVESKFSVRTYKHLIMALTGLLAVLGSVVAFLFIDPLAALVIACGGLLKGVAYEIGTFILPNQTKGNIKHFHEKTAIGEFVTGLFAYGGLAIGFAIS